jgi:hypothetical protein
MNVFNQLSPKSMLFNSDESVFEKNNKVHNDYITFVIDNVFTAVCIQEMNNNPECHEVSKTRSQT